jgi:hypothetical protein
VSRRAGSDGGGRCSRGELAVRVLCVALAAACSSKPPPDFAPDPSLIGRISEIRMHTEGSWVCPGNTIRASYDAVLDDGSVVPFATEYDSDHPPALHVVFLRRTSPEASPRKDGGWDTNRDPLVSALEGFRLNAFMLAKPSLNVSTVVKPEYSCLGHVFSFVGGPGKRGEGGGVGPDVTVRLDVMSSPFHEELLLGGIEVGNAPPFYVLADAAMVPPADWLILESRGGPGGRGVDGADGVKGAAGSDGCPAGPGGAGGRGGNGGVGGPGGPGGRTVVIVPSERPLLAGMVEARGSGGAGGRGGRAGKGGPGGDGGRGIAGTRRCGNGQEGPVGEDGNAGPAGPEGNPGPRSQIIMVPAADLFVDQRVMSLVEYNRPWR